MLFLVKFDFIKINTTPLVFFLFLKIVQMAPNCTKHLIWSLVMIFDELCN